jgi:AcrR family transcriptional regulator
MDQEVRIRRRRKEARPAEIIAAAMALWGDRGFAATRLEDVAQRAGISKGTIYLYFASKEALFEAAIREQLISTFHSALDASALGDLSTADVLRRLFQTVRQRLLDDDAIILFRVLLGEGQRFPELIELYRDVAMSRGFELMRAVLARGVVRGELRPGAEGVDPRILMGPLMMGALTSSLLGSHVPPIDDAFIDQHLDLVLDGLARRA